MKRKFSALTVYLAQIFILFGWNAGAQTGVVSQVDAFIRTEMQKQKIPGISLGVIKNGKLIYAKGYGFANVEHKVSVKPESVFQSGSVGKQFTAMCIMILVEDGKINLEDKINKYFAGTPPEWNNITIRHLLTHTSGMTDFPKGFNYRADYSEEELYKQIQNVPLYFKPGEKWAYSNIGYIMLGILVNKVSGKFYGDFLQERVFKPLEMSTARVINEADIIPNRVSGYNLVDGKIKNQDWVSPTVNTTADGSLYLTILDMAKWEEALNSKKLISKKGYEALWSPVTLNSGKTHPYGFGWMFDFVNGEKIIEHSGSWQGFKSMITRYPFDKFAVIIFCQFIRCQGEAIGKGRFRNLLPKAQTFR